ncbi:hypothetical protein BDZ90DRAFT_133661 [Jaminaea rosea]|uniref:SUN domain-containing protein n=1 Tax=Jaminaea rosea TaxID=1569628 RepID=A0A316UUA1_9BASI|nr:hypothetical protein BDZ90DRAFT_133661 [Jaminaea rosea]PWN28886.1 hypothetical protein BDZ90DRAFT_133661 [Jaminaea rosea]
MSSPRRAASRALARSESIDAAGFDNGNDSPNTSAGRRRSRPEVSRKVIHQSFAYGAPSDGTMTAKRSTSGGKRGGSAAGSPDTSAESMAKEEQEAAASTQQPAAPAASRYAALKARKQSGGAAAKKGAASGLVSASSPATRRSARLSVASGSQDADNAARTRAMADFEDDEGESDDEEDDAQGKARKSSVPPPPVAGVRSAGGYQLSSYFVRAPVGSMSPGPSEDRRSMMPSSLLRGAQRPSHDPLSPRRGDMDGSMRSSDAGDSRSFASEEAFVRRDIDRDMTPPARGGARGWLANLSPWNKGANSSGSSRARRDPDFVPDAAEETEENHLQRRKARKSKDDAVYKPSEDGEEEDDDDISDDDGRKGRRRKSGDVDKSARGGRDDNRIWMGAKKRKGRKGRRSDGTEMGVDDSQEVVYDDDAQEAAARPSVLHRAAATGTQAADTWSGSSMLKTVGLAVAGLAVLGAISPNLSNSPSTRSSAPSSSVPLFGSFFSGRGTFTASNIPPSDFDAFVSRLLSLETTVGSLSATSDSLLKSHKEMARQVSTLELSSKEVRSLLRRIEEDSRLAQSKLDGKTKSLEDVGKRLREQVDKLEAHVAATPSSSSADTDALRRENDKHRQQVEVRLEKLRADLKGNEDQMAKMAASVKSAETVANQAKQALQPLLEANLPAQMPVKIDKRTGKPQIEPWFYESLKSVVASADGSSSGGGQGDDSFSWDSFKRAHGAALRALVHEESSDLFEERRKSHALVSRSDFLALLQAEIETMKGSLEETFNENAQSMQNEILGKVRAQQAMFEESGSWSKGGKKIVAEESAAASVPLSLPDLGQLRSKDGADPRNSILALIDAALDTYSMSKTNKADFALYSAGGRVIPSLTSPTFEMTARGPNSGKQKGWLPWSSASKPVTQFRSRSPVVALHHDNAPGMCWPFAGSNGQLGIQLARPAVVTDFTIEHPPASLTFGDSSTAPRDITVWGLVQREEDREKLRRWRESESARGEDRAGEMDMMPAPPSPNHLHLATFTYEAGGNGTASAPGRRPRSVQTFPVSPEAAALGIPVSVVQVRFLSNHGNRDYTCSYRVQVHGVAYQQQHA